VDARLCLPRSMNRLAVLIRDGTLDRRRRFQLHVLGQRLSSGQPDIEFWRHERLPLPLIYLDDPALRTRLGDALELAEWIGQLLQPGWHTVENSGKPFRVPRPLQLLGQELIPSIGEGKERQKAIGNIVRHLAPERAYWPALETPFRQFLIALADDCMVEDGEDVYGRRELPRWATTLRRTAWAAFRHATNGLDTSARALKAVAVAEQDFGRRLHGVLGDLLASKPEGGEA
jgi:CRISPR system Cascade subunit CasA